jgi:hypothetical protein
MVVQSVPASWLPNAVSPGQVVPILSTAASGAAVFQALGVTGPLTPTPLGTLGIDPTWPTVFFPIAIAPASGVVSLALPAPAALPRGQAFTTQSVVWDGNLLQFGMPTTFVVQ